MKEAMTVTLDEKLIVRACEEYVARQTGNPGLSLKGTLVNMTDRAVQVVVVASKKRARAKKVGERAARAAAA